MMDVIPKKSEKTKKSENWITDHKDSTDDCPKKGTQIRADSHRFLLAHSRDCPQVAKELFFSTDVGDFKDFCLRTSVIVH